MIEFFNATTLEFIKYKKDIKYLVKLAYLASFQKELITKDFLSLKIKQLEDYLNKNQCFLLLAKHKARVIGICHYFIKNDFEGIRGHINQISIHPSFQGKNYALPLSSKMGGGRA
ncbi:GNAT family N-acetyltransferase [Helicobacter sp. MIT 14-3879]|uniref:GNAT family N-acetyltransferase n=1 Tax=Helicobacter sp. MIT 14-3879 TaxID=2040649 RepID=UPI000E1ED429|nr:GNAT family N-acetyltransferase [Helicobacter sp. MIT 14-3879]RDU64783.1 hypothetical protein CQA44_03470 [Helicobacter sp. MIT 14-3879]